MDSLASSTFCVLFFHCRPSAVLRTVALVVVDAVNSLSVRTATHVFEKVFKGAPVFANRNAATAIVFVVAMLWVSAALVNPGPNVVFGRSRHSVSRESGAEFLCSNAAAAGGSTVGHVGFSGDHYSAALARELPEVSLASDLYKPHSGQSSKFFTCNIGRRGKASTANSIATSKVRASNFDLIAAIASAKPPCIAVDVASDAGYRSKNPELPPSHILNHDENCITVGHSGSISEEG